MGCGERDYGSVAVYWRLVGHPPERRVQLQETYPATMYSYGAQRRHRAGKETCARGQVDRQLSRA